MNRSAFEPRTKNLLGIVADLYQLLEEYAPTWYSEELRERLLAALKMRGDCESRPSPLHQ
jgi:hypothetical protein